LRLQHANGELELHPQSGLKLENSTPADKDTGPRVADGALCAIKDVVNTKHNAVKKQFFFNIPSDPRCKSLRGK
jgi:hypothetical protein